MSDPHPLAKINIEGFNAFGLGFLLWHNPYEPATPQFDAWADGWREAEMYNRGEGEWTI